MRIIVPLDGSQLAERALEPATHLLRHAAAPRELILVRAINTILSEQSAPNMAADGAAALQSDDATAASLDYLSQIAHSAALRGIAVTSLALQGVPAEVVSELAGAYYADLIVLTSHGRTGIVRQALGSVAATIARASAVPTLIARPEGQTFADVDRQESLTLLVPLDGSALAEAAIAPALRIAKAQGGAIRLLRVVCDSTGDVARQRDHNRAAFDYLTRWHDQLTAQGITTQRRIAWGEPAQAIAAETQHYPVDMVVIATHGRDSMNRRERESITETILHSLRLPVVVAHPAAISRDGGESPFSSAR